MKLSIWTFIFIGFGMSVHVNAGIEGANNKKNSEGVNLINGITLEAPPRRVDGQWAKEIQEVNGNWVAIVPYAFSPKGEGRVYYNIEHRKGHHGQWWGEQPEGVAETIRQAKARGLAIMLKPQVWFRNGWAVDFTLATEKEWKKWESGYTAYIKVMVDLACDLKVEMICLGTELKHSYKLRTGYWEWLIAEVRKVYDGKLTVAANWDNYEQISFWNKLDYIGIDAYFPLSTENEPTLKSLLTKWEPIYNDLAKMAEQHKKPILFTEYGYRSIPQCTWNNWEKEWKYNFPINLKSQATAYEALYRTFWGQEWFGGGFLWKWRVQQRLSHKKQDASYSPQNKPTEKVVRRIYGQYRTIQQ